MDQLLRLGRGGLFVCCCLSVVMWFLFEEVSSSSGYFGWAALFCYSAPSAFRVVVFQNIRLLLRFCVHCIYKESKNIFI